MMEKPHRQKHVGGVILDEGTVKLLCLRTHFLAGAKMAFYFVGFGFRILLIFLAVFLFCFLSVRTFYDLPRLLAVQLRLHIVLLPYLTILWKVGTGS